MITTNFVGDDRRRKQAVSLSKRSERQRKGRGKAEERQRKDQAVPNSLKRVMRGMWVEWTGLHRLFSAAKRSTLLQHSPAPMSSLPCPLPSSCILPSLLLPSASLSPHPLACNLVSLDLWARHTVRTECGCAGRASGGGDLPVTEVIRASMVEDSPYLLHELWERLVEQPCPHQRGDRPMEREGRRRFVGREAVF